MWLTNNQGFGSGDIWDKSPSRFLKILKLSSFYSGNFKIFKTALKLFITNCPPKHVVNSISSSPNCQLGKGFVVWGTAFNSFFIFPTLFFLRDVENEGSIWRWKYNNWKEAFKLTIKVIDLIKLIRFFLTTNFSAFPYSLPSTLGKHSPHLYFPCN